MQRRSELSPQKHLELPGVLLLDSTGELGSVYELATVAFVGGTLVPTGGHNILEPACFGKPIVIGPSMTNFQEIADVFLHNNPSRDPRQAGAGRKGAGTNEIPGAENIRIGAIVQLPDAEALTPTLRFLFQNPVFRRHLGEAARRLLEKELNPTDRILGELERLLAPRLPMNGRAADLSSPAMVEAHPPKL